MLRALCTKITHFFQYLVRDPYYALIYPAARLNPNYRSYPINLSDEELVDQIKQGKSIIRMGDGETFLMLGGSIHYEPHNTRLREYLFKIVEEYDYEESPYVLGVNTLVLSATNRELKKKKEVRVWLPSKIYFNRFYPKTEKYFNASMFYHAHQFNKILEEVLREHHVVLVTSDENYTRLIQSGKFQSKSCRHVSVPALNSFSVFDETLEDVIQMVGSSAGQIRVLASAGPMSKPLVYELSKLGITAYDLGRGIETIYDPHVIEHLVQ